MKRILPLVGVAALCAMACSSTPQADSPNNESGVTPTGIQPAERTTTTSPTTQQQGADWMNPAATKPMAPDAQSPESAPTRPEDSSAPKTMTGGTTENAPSRPDADNTRVNARDKGSANLTPTDQGGGAGDRRTTQLVRKAVMADSSLSFAAKNVKIITVNGMVTLRGAVKTDQERASIEAAAKKVAGDAQVDNQIEVKK